MVLSQSQGSVLKRILKKREAFFLALLGLLLFGLEHKKNISYWDFAWDAVWLMVGTVAYYFLLEGLRGRLRFSPVPKSMMGLPILLLTAALLALTLSRFQAIVASATKFN